MKIVKLARGEEIVVAEGTRKQLMNRLKQLRSSTNGKASGIGGKKYTVTYKLVD